MESAFALALVSGLMFSISSLNDTVLKGFFSVGVFLLHAVSALVAVAFLWLEKNYRYPLSPIAPFFTDEKIQERSWRREMGDGSVKILHQLFVAIDSLKKNKAREGNPETLSLFASISVFGKENPQLLLRNYAVVNNFISVYETLIQYDPNDETILALREELKAGLRDIVRELSAGKEREAEPNIKRGVQLLEKVTSVKAPLRK